MIASYKTDVLHRLKIICGHLEKVIKMVEKEEYCLDIIQQTKAVENALKKVDNLLLENHLKTCVRQAIVSGENVDEKVKEIVEIFERK